MFVRTGYTYAYYNHSGHNTIKQNLASNRQKYTHMELESRCITIYLSIPIRSTRVKSLTSPTLSVPAMLPHYLRCTGYKLAARIVPHPGANTRGMIYSSYDPDALGSVTDLLKLYTKCNLHSCVDVGT